MSSIMRRRNGLIASSVMGMLLSCVKVVNPLISRQDAPSPIVITVPHAAARYRASGLVLWPGGDIRQ
jgi:hypothetical protein